MGTDRSRPRTSQSGPHCPRIGSARAVDEHRRCPYCFGASREIAAGEHSRFCDFRPGEDPVCFGFPETRGRYC